MICAGHADTYSLQNTVLLPKRHDYDITEHIVHSSVYLPLPSPLATHHSPRYYLPTTLLAAPLSYSDSPNQIVTHLHQQKPRTPLLNSRNAGELSLPVLRKVSSWLQEVEQQRHSDLTRILRGGDSAAPWIVATQAALSFSFYFIRLTSLNVKCQRL